MKMFIVFNILYILYKNKDYLKNYLSLIEPVMVSMSIPIFLFSSINWVYAIEISEKSFATLERSISHAFFFRKKIKESFTCLCILKKFCNNEITLVVWVHTGNREQSSSGQQGRPTYCSIKIVKCFQIRLFMTFFLPD